MNTKQYKGGVILGIKPDGTKYTQVEALNFFISNLGSVRVLTDQSISCISLVLNLSDGLESPYILRRPNFTNSYDTKTFVNSVLLKIMLNDNKKDAETQSSLPYTPSNGWNRVPNKELNRLKDLTREVEIHTDIYKRSFFSDENLFDPICPTIFFASRLNEEKTNRLYEIIFPHLTEEDKKKYGYGINFFFKNKDYKSVSVICMEFFHDYDTIDNILIKIGKPEQDNFELRNQRILCLSLALYEIVKLWKMGYKHGDLHPGNILVNMDVEYVCDKTRIPKGRAILIDFGRSEKHGSLIRERETDLKRWTEEWMAQSNPKLMAMIFGREARKPEEKHWIHTYINKHNLKFDGLHKFWHYNYQFNINRLQIYLDYKTNKLNGTTGTAALEKIQSINDELEKTKKSDENPMVIEEKDITLDFPSQNEEKYDDDGFFGNLPPLSPNSAEDSRHLNPLTINDLPKDPNFSSPPIANLHSPPTANLPPPTANLPPPTANLPPPISNLSASSHDTLNEWKNLQQPMNSGISSSGSWQGWGSPTSSTGSFNPEFWDHVHAAPLPSRRSPSPPSHLPPLPRRRSSRSRHRSPSPRGSRKKPRINNGGKLSYIKSFFGSNKNRNNSEFLELLPNSQAMKNPSNELHSQPRNKSYNKEYSKEELDIIIEDGNINKEKIILSEKEMEQLFPYSSIEIRPAEKVGGISKNKNKNNKSYHFSKRLSKKFNYLRRKNNKTKKVFI